MIDLTKSEARNLAEFIEMTIFESIRNDTDIDNPMWLLDIMHAYEKLSEYGGYVSLYKSDED